MADLAEMVAAQRSLLDNLQDGHGNADRNALERTLSLLIEQMRELGGPVFHAPRDPFAAAEDLADVLRFEVPRSHRNRFGSLVTGAKRAFVKGLAPINVEALRPQCAFNFELVRALRTARSLRAAGISDGEGEKLRRQLEALAEPAKWRVHSHRSGRAGRAVEMSKNAALVAIGPVLRDMLSTQREFNTQAIDLVVLSLQSNKDGERTTSLFRKLEELADPVNAPGASIVTKSLRPFWNEVLRRQVAFNAQVTAILAQMLQLPQKMKVAPSLPYAEWIARREPLRIEAIAHEAKTLPDRLHVSMVMWVGGASMREVSKTIASIQKRTFGTCEICVAISSESSLLAEMSRLAERSDGIRLVRVDSAFCAAEALNAACAAATGEFIGVVSPGDTVAPHAFGAVAVAAQRKDGAVLVYSDQDVLGEDGKRTKPFFKPDWSPDFLGVVGYLDGLPFIEHSTIKAVGGFRSGFDGAETFDLLLRIAERFGNRVAHAPDVLLHGRAIEPTEAHRKAFSELQERMRGGKVEIANSGELRVRREVQGHPLISIIVPFKDKPELLRQLLDGLAHRTAYAHYEILLVSNNSVQPETHELLASLTDPRIRQMSWNHPFNYSAINNFAAREARGELLLFLNNDIEAIEPEWLEELIAQAQRPEVGAVGAKLFFADRTVQHAGVVVGIGGFAAHPFSGLPDKAMTPFGSSDWTRDCSAVTGACLMMRRDVFERIGGFDERMIVCGSDVELCLRAARAGLRTLYTPYARLIHHESITRGPESIPEGDFWLSFLAYRPLLSAGDPFYNPNLTLTAFDCGLRADDRSAEQMALDALVRWLPEKWPTATEDRERQVRRVADSLVNLSWDENRAAEQRERGPRHIQALRNKGRIESVAWFVPHFGHAFGGIQTILRFGDLLRKRHGVASTFIVYDNAGAAPAEYDARVGVEFPDLVGNFRVLKERAQLAQLPSCDLAIATLWASAYAVMDYQGAAAKAYFVQDFEPLFYAAGTYYALAEQTYRLGLYGIFNSPGLLDFVTANYPMTGCSFEPAVDPKIFHDRRPPSSGPLRVFFYGRPSIDRNAFELGLAALRELKRSFGPEIRIFSAGEEWSPETYRVNGIIENLGILPYAKTADLYRTCDVGLCFMFTKHPSYLPLEMMACGVTVVTNQNPANRWLLEDGRNCLLAEPSSPSVVSRLTLALKDRSLRERLGVAAAERLRRTTWEEQVEAVYRALTSNASQEQQTVLKEAGA